MAIGASLAKHQTFSAALILTLVLHVCFFPFIWGDKTLLASSRGTTASILPNGAWSGGSVGPRVPRANDMGAAAWLPEPDAPLIRNQYFGEKHVPLWNPYQACGAPLAANMQSQPFQPLYFLYTLAPGPRTYNFFLLLRFLITGLGAYLYLRLFLPFTPSICGGIACMLSGYYILFFNMPHISVEMLVPALFFATERLLRAQSTGNVVLAAVVTFLCIIGGMPESSFLAFVFVGGYFLFRGAGGAGPRLRQLKYFVSAQLLGLALAAILLIPFFEFMGLSFDTHQPSNRNGIITGLLHDPFGLSIFTYVAPLIYGLAWNPIAPALGGYGTLRGFVGVVQILFAILAVGRLSRRKVTLYFAVAAAVIVLKRYGAPVVNGIGHLPFFQMVLFAKYDEALLAFAMAVLCAFGIHHFLRNEANWRRTVLALAIVLAVLGAAWGLSLGPVAAAKADTGPFYKSLAGAGAVLLAAAVLLLAPFPRRWLPAALAMLLVGEMAGNYIFPVYYFMTHSAGDDANPYFGAPYIDYLKAGTTGQERIFGRDAIMHPAWASAFQLADIRSLDAMYYRKYFEFVRFFTREDMPAENIGDLANRFSGVRWLAADTPLKRRMLQLSSVKYLLSLQPYGTGAGWAQEIVQQNKGRLAAGRESLVEVRTFTIQGQTKPVLYEHPTYARLPFRIGITPDRRELSFDLALAPAVYDGSMPICGAGVDFQLEVRDGAGQIRPLFNRYIDPKHNLAERHWIPASVDLGAYLGQTVDLLFTTKPGPQGDTCAAWAGWGDPRFNSDAGGPLPFRQVYNHEIRIYEYLDFVPRAALFSSVEIVPDDRAALARLGDPAFDIFQTAVVTAGAAVRDFSGGPAERVRAANIVSYSSQEAVIDASTDRPALLVLNDVDFPGWKVYVDGRPSHWITANYMFRGVLLAPGSHRVRFAYKPASFTWGAGISGAALLSLAGFAIWHKRSRVAEPNLV